MHCRCSRRPPEAAPDVNQHHKHRHPADDEIAKDGGSVIDATEEQRTDTHVAVDGGISHEGELPSHKTPGERRSTGGKQSEKPQSVTPPIEHSREQCPK